MVRHVNQECAKHINLIVKLKRSVMRSSASHTPYAPTVHDVNTTWLCFPTFCPLPRQHRSFFSSNFHIRTQARRGNIIVHTIFNVLGNQSQLVLHFRAGINHAVYTRIRERAQVSRNSVQGDGGKINGVAVVRPDPVNFSRN